MATHWVEWLAISFINGYYQGVPGTSSYYYLVRTTTSREQPAPERELQDFSMVLYYY